MTSQIREAIEHHSTNWSPSIAEIFVQLYGQFHHDQKLSAKYAAIVKENIPYGPHERNVLDLYLPVDAVSSPRGVFCYMHGGGLVGGDKSLYKGSLYANIGRYFASHGFVVAVMNYRLVPGVTYPGGGEDVQLVREWIYNNISKSEYGNGDPERVVLAGHSAGGLHIATNLYAAGDPDRQSRDPLFPPLAGVIYLSTPFGFASLLEFRRPALIGYYEEEERIRVVCPVGLLETLPEGSPVLDPKILPTLIVAGQYDPKEIQDPVFQFIDRYRKKTPQGLLPEVSAVAGHNHLSHVCSIGTEDDVLGRIMLEFIVKVCSK
ncbi:Alpha/Beta hydrolase protein [Rhodocollybia butyracea]|uniref:Alpha/Beta hydrolase protein n=1 Tax=Rhodocollybia butyracea TaxID=206335 RepID=A0A9P5U9G4_9AGAR|nr:Alpha/Beta hydrolase protein [Rhodocollybia butyracea]